MVEAGENFLTEEGWGRRTGALRRQRTSRLGDGKEG